MIELKIKTEVLSKIILMLLISFQYSCKDDFLKVLPKGVLNENNMINSSGVNTTLIAAYSLLDQTGGVGSGNGISGSNWVFGGVTSDEAVKGSSLGDLQDINTIETFRLNSAITLLNNQWRVLYDGVQRANDVIRLVSKVRDEDMSPMEKTEALAEARFLRAHFHFQLKRIFNNISFIDETVTYQNNNFNVPNDVDAYPRIEDDLRFADYNLPNTQTSIGRVNKWAAKAYLGKVYLYEHKFSEARFELDSVISFGVNTSGVKFKLLQNYGNNFNADFNDNSETVFAVKFSVNDGSSNANNGNRGDRLNGPYNWANIHASGFYQPTQSLVNSFRVDDQGLPYLNTFDDIDVKNDQGLTSDQPFVPDNTTLDPRLDWTVGRRGIPYLDWGVFPGNNAIREQSSGGPYDCVKTTYRKSQTGINSDATAQYGTYSNINYCIIRYSDVLLMAAEAEIEEGNLERARELTNIVRARAANPVSWVYKYIDDNNPANGFSNTPAANYKVGLYDNFPNADYARKAVRFERKLEFGMEGRRFFDLVRYGTVSEEMNKFFNKAKLMHSYYNGVIFTSGKNEYMPIPQVQIDLSKGILVQNEGY